MAPVADGMHASQQLADAAKHQGFDSPRRLENKREGLPETEEALSGSCQG